MNHKTLQRENIPVMAQLHKKVDAASYIGNSTHMHGLYQEDQLWISNTSKRHLEPTIKHLQHARTPQTSPNTKTIMI